MPACHAGDREFDSRQLRHFFATVAQLVEQRTENPRVVGSIPTRGTSIIKPSGVYPGGVFSFLMPIWCPKLFDYMLSDLPRHQFSTPLDFTQKDLHAWLLEEYPHEKNKINEYFDESDCMSDEDDTLD